MTLDSRSRRRHGPELERAILEAAWQQLLDGGNESFTIDAVAERAGTSRSVVYRRWPDRDALVGATIVHGLREATVDYPDTGALRSDILALLRASNAARGEIAPLLSVLIAAHFSHTGTTFAQLRTRILQEGPTRGMDDILDRAVARGEIDPAVLTPRVRAVTFDLFRHDLLMTLQPLADEDLVAIVDEVCLPLLTRRP